MSAKVVYFTHTIFAFFVIFLYLRLSPVLFSFCLVLTCSQLKNQQLLFHVISPQDIQAISFSEKESAWRISKLCEVRHCRMTWEWNKEMTWMMIVVPSEKDEGEGMLVEDWEKNLRKP